MSNDAEGASVSTPALLLTLFCGRPRQSVPNPPPRMTEPQGRAVGRAEARALLTKSEQDKGEALTQSEVREHYQARFVSRMDQYDRGELPRPWFDGWCQGFADICIQVGRSAPDEVGLAEEPPPLVRTLVTFRQATIEVGDPDAFFEGVLCGQVCAVEERRPLTGERLFELFEGAVGDEEASETWLTGYILGLSDALCRKRKRNPWWQPGISKRPLFR